MAPLGRVVIIRRTGIDGTHFPLSRNSCLFGRGTECDIRIQLPMVSKQHCKIEMRQQEALLINLSDSIPTQLNGAHVNHPVVLKNGDIITIVDRSFRFECGHVPGGSNTTEYLEQKCKEVMEKIIKEPRSLLVPANSPELSEENSPTDTKVPLHQEDFIRKLLINIDQKVNSASLQKSAMSLGSPIISVADVSSSYDSSSGIEEKKKEQVPLQRKRVSFGGTLRPEVFDKQMPSNMPLRRGETPKKNKFLGTQLPSILKKTVKVPMDQVPNVFSTGYGNTSCTTTAGTASVENLKVPEDFSAAVKRWLKPHIVSLELQDLRKSTKTEKNTRESGEKKRIFPRLWRHNKVFPEIPDHLENQKSTKKEEKKTLQLRKTSIFPRL